MVSRQTADGSAIYLWLYTSNLNLSLARMSGFWRGMAECLPVVLLPCLKLACLSWTMGLLIGVYARQTRWLSGGGLIGVLLCAGILGLPHGFGLTLTLGSARDYFGNAAVFTSTFFRAVYPQIIELLLSVLPFFYGLRQRFLVGSLPRSDRLVTFIAFGASIGALVCQSSASWVFHLWDHWPTYLPGLPSPITMASFGSAAYLYLTVRPSRKVISAHRLHFQR